MSWADGIAASEIYPRRTGLPPDILPLKRCPVCSENKPLGSPADPERRLSLSYRGGETNVPLVNYEV